MVSNTFMGRTALISSLSCDSVMAGAFFPQLNPHMPEEKVSQHAGDHMVTPPRIFPYLVVVHSQIGLGFLETLFNSPADAREPDKGFQPGGAPGWMTFLAAGTMRRRRFRATEVIREVPRAGLPSASPGKARRR